MEFEDGVFLVKIVMAEFDENERGLAEATRDAVEKFVLGPGFASSSDEIMNKIFSHLEKDAPIEFIVKSEKVWLIDSGENESDSISQILLIVHIYDLYDFHQIKQVIQEARSRYNRG